MRIHRAVLALAMLAVSVAGNALAAPAPPPGAPPFSGWLAPDGGLRGATEAAAPTYHANTGLFTPAANPTDVLAIYDGNYSPVMFVKRITVFCLASSGGAFPVRLQQTTNANLGTGSPTTLSAGNGFITRHDVSDPSPAGAVQYWTTNPTSRNGVSSTRSLISEQDLVCGTSGTNAGTPVVFDFAATRMKSLPIKYTSNQLLAVNLNAVSLPSGAQLRIEVEWEEQHLPLVCFIGDSTTSNATIAYLNGGAYAGGFGHSGAINSYVNAQNWGSNGFRLADIINNINSPTFPIGQIFGTGVGSPNTTSALQTTSPYQNCDVIILTMGLNDVRQGGLGVDQASMTNRMEALLDTFIYAVKNGGVSSGTYTSPLATSYTISNISWVGNVATVTTQSPHQFGTAAGGESYSGGGVAVTISGSSNANFNGTWQLASVVDASNFTLTMVGNPGAFAGTAQEQFATIWYTTFSAMPSAKIILYSPNSLTADDPAASGGPFYYMMYPQNAGGTLVGVWNGLTLAQAAQGASNVLFSSYAVFAGDARVFDVVHKQSAGGGPFPSTVQTFANSPLMANQLHPGAYGQRLEQEQIAPVILQAVQAVMAARF